MGIHSIRTTKNERSPDGGRTRPGTRIDENTDGLAAHLESGRLCIINTPMCQELNSFEVDFTSAGNMRLTCARGTTTAIW